MPYINIYEEDIQRLASFDTIDNAVLIFGFDFSKINGGKQVLEDGYKLYTSLTDFLTDMHTNIQTITDIYDLSELVRRPFITAYDCLANGLPVMYVTLDAYINSEFIIDLPERKIDAYYVTATGVKYDGSGTLVADTTITTEYKYYVEGTSESGRIYYRKVDEQIVEARKYVEYNWLSDITRVPEVEIESGELKEDTYWEENKFTIDQANKYHDIYTSDNAKTSAEDSLFTLLTTNGSGETIIPFSDRINFPITFITTCGFETIVSNTEVQPDGRFEPLIMTNLSRSDVVYLLDIPSDIKPEDVTTRLAGLAPSRPELTSIVYPWGTFNSYTGISNLHMPGSYAYLMAYANSIRNNKPWLAAAGVNRGIIPNIIDIDYKVREAFVHSWQGDVEGSPTGYRINPLIDLGQTYGKVIFGNRTCVASPGTALRFSDFLNIRLLLSVLHKQAFNSSVQHMFEPNDDIVWLSFKQKVNDILDQMVTGRGIKWYKWYKLQPDRLGQIKARLVIRPIEAVEAFDITISMTDYDIEVEVE